ncbi:MAG: hypothetical protein OEW37_00065 [Rhodospirillaceae bacterium]|nr:hypothetical protein [Rhodospirillaceae bacterium]
MSGNNEDCKRRGVRIQTTTPDGEHIPPAGLVFLILDGAVLITTSLAETAQPQYRADEIVMLDARAAADLGNKLLEAAGFLEFLASAEPGLAAH